LPRFLADRWRFSGHHTTTLGFGAHTPLHEQVLVGDATGCVILSARNGTHLAPVTSPARPPAFLAFSARTAQVPLCKPGVCLTLRNAKIDMFQGCMRLAVDKWGTPCQHFRSSTNDR
jgi:hypothetical protein